MDNMRGSDGPLISILTPTWQRHDELENLIKNILWRSYRPIEHIIVSDVPDPELIDLIDRKYSKNIDHQYHIKYVECGKNWSTFLPDSYTAIPLMTATALASGNYHMWMSDDERMLVPYHIDKLLQPLINGEADFSYSKVLMYSIKHNIKYVIGKPTPEYGHMTHCMYNVELLKKGMYRPFVGSAGDWDVIHRWMEQNAKWAFIDDITFYHRADK